MWTRAGMQTDKGCSVLLEKLPTAEREQSRGCKEPEPADTHPSQGRAPQRMRHDISAERELPEAREAHQWVLAATAALEERIERLSWSTITSRAGPCIPSQSHDRHRRQHKRHCRALPEDNPIPSPPYSQGHQRVRRLSCPT